MEKLPKKFKKQWVAALTSGEYKQGKYNLEDYDNTYCCLGVAGKIAGCTNMIKKSVLLGAEGVIGLKKVPKTIKGSASKFSPKHYNPIVRGLTDMNDIGVPFEVIAGFIHENL